MFIAKESVRMGRRHEADRVRERGVRAEG